MQSLVPVGVGILVDYFVVDLLASIDVDCRLVVEVEMEMLQMLEWIAASLKPQIVRMDCDCPFLINLSFQGITNLIGK